MNKNIKLAVAGAVLAASASVANAGIIIPAGEWTVDINGNVNTYTTWSRSSGNATINGGVNGLISGANATGTRTNNNFTTGLLPSWLGVTGSTRQNDLDVSFTISLQPGASNTQGLQNGNNGNGVGNENRQAFITFGDKSWGSVKIGKDLGVFASDAILNDMTLLGVGSGAGQLNGTTTLGRIGTGFIYADWKTQIMYTTPNFNGFQATAGISQGWNQVGNASTRTTQSVGGAGSVSSTTVALADGSLNTTNRAGSSPAYEGKASYSFAMNDVTGKVWVSGIAQKVSTGTAGVYLEDPVAYAGDIGANVNVAGFGITGYYYNGSGIGTTAQFRDGYTAAGVQRDSDGGYVQVTYVLPTKTKVGVSWGESNLDKAGADTDTLLRSTFQLYVTAVRGRVQDRDCSEPGWNWSTASIRRWIHDHQ